MSILWWIGYALAFWGGFDLARRLHLLWTSTTSGRSIYTDRDAGGF